MSHWILEQGCFKNIFELLNLRANKISILYKDQIIPCMGKIVCVEFQRLHLKYHTKYLTRTLKDDYFIQCWTFKSTPHPPTPPPPPPPPPPTPLVPHICVSGYRWYRRQAIIETNSGILSIRPLGTNFSEILIKIQNISFTKKHLKISSAKWRPFCPGRDELTLVFIVDALWRIVYRSYFV